MRKSPFSVFFVLLAGCSSESLDGSGVIVTEARTVPEFHGISITENLVAEIATGPTSVDVEMDDNLVQRVATHVEGGILIIEPGAGEPELRPTTRARIRVKMPKLDSIEASRAAAVRAEGSATALSITTSGQAAVAFSGGASSVVVDAHEASRVDCHAASRQAEVTSTGSSNVRVHASERLRVTATDAASVNVSGQPPSREVVTTDAARVVFSD